MENSSKLTLQSSNTSELLFEEALVNEGLIKNTTRINDVIGPCFVSETIENAKSPFVDVVIWLEKNKMADGKKQITKETGVSYWWGPERISFLNVYNLAKMTKKNPCFTEAQINEYLRKNRNEMLENGGEVGLFFLFERNKKLVVASVLLVSNFVENKLKVFCGSMLNTEYLLQCRVNYIVLPKIIKITPPN